MKVQEGYVYHISDDYFAKAKDDKLMQNKEGGTYRPTFLCLEDRKNPGLLWVVPMSTRVEKYRAIQKNQIAKHGRCLTIVIGEFDGQQAAFLLQNMFPITERYLDHIHTHNGNPVPVKHSIIQKVRMNMMQLRQMIYRGQNIVFTDVRRLESLMLEELQAEKSVKLSKSTEDLAKQKSEADSHTKPSLLNALYTKHAAVDAASRGSKDRTMKHPGKGNPGGRDNR